MKKILFLFLIVSFNLFSWEIKLSKDTVQNFNAVYKLTTQNGTIYFTRIINGVIDFNGNNIGSSLYSLKHGTSSNLISNDSFFSILKSNPQYMNDFYLHTANIDWFLNYLYNDKSFSNSNYIHYENYELLYDSSGLVVESIVDGVWAGMYADNQKTKSGAMYDKNGSMIYYNGKAVDPVTSFLVWLQKFTNKVVLEAFEEIRKSLVTVMIVSVILVLGLVRLVLELLPASITPRRRRYYGGGRGSLSDYGDGSQVAASVRARLAAKNRALKARAYDRSGFEQSLQNSILFDLENSDR